MDGQIVEEVKVSGRKEMETMGKWGRDEENICRRENEASSETNGCLGGNEERVRKVEGCQKLWKVEVCNKRYIILVSSVREVS